MWCYKKTLEIKKKKKYINYCKKEILRLVFRVLPVYVLLFSVGKKKKKKLLPNKLPFKIMWIVRDDYVLERRVELIGYPTKAQRIRD